MSEVISFAAFQRKRTEIDAPAEWTNSERAELYRVEAILHQSGISIETEEGISDEGDPWFVFCRTDGDVLIHIVRTDGQYSFHSPALTHPLRGRSFSELCTVFQELFPVRVAVRDKEQTNILLHPAAILSLVVGTIFLSFDEMLSTRAEAATLDALRTSLPVDTNGSEVADSPHEAVSALEYQKSVEQFQTLAVKNLKAVLGGRIEGTQSQTYAALTSSLLIFAAGSLDAVVHPALADETKSERASLVDISERHDGTASLSFDVGIARNHDHASLRLSPAAEEAKIVGEHLVFIEAANGKQQVEAEAPVPERHIDNTNAFIQFDFSPHLKPEETAGFMLGSHEAGAAHASWRNPSSQSSNAHSAENSKTQGLAEVLPVQETKAQSPNVTSPQPSDPAQGTSVPDRGAIPSSHDETTARVDTVEVLLTSLPETLGSSLHFSREPVKFMLEEWDKIDFGKETDSGELGKADTATPASPISAHPPEPDTHHADILSEKLNAVELALYDKVLGYQAGGNLSHFDLEAKTQILKFVEKAADIDIIVSDHVIMFVDEAVHASSGSTPFMKIWETGDGEAISIVGVTGSGHAALA